MTRKDFVLIAEAIGRAGLDADARQTAAASLAQALATDSTRFDVGRFLAHVESSALSGDRYNIIRFCFNEKHPDHRRIIARGLTLAQARAHCRDESTHGEDAERGQWFEGYELAP